MWTRLGILEIINEAKRVDRSGSIILEHILVGPPRQVPAKPNLEVKQIIAVGGWYLWWIRRRYTHNGNPPPAFKWPISVLAISNNFDQANAKRTGSVQERWEKPEPRFVKLNVNAAFYVEEGVGATAAVIRDVTGSFLAPQCIYIPVASSVVTTEALAMRDGMKFANSLGFPRVEAESDSLTVIDSCCGQARWWDEAAAIFAECVDVSTLIGKVKFKHCPRNANKAAHVLAKHSYCNKFSSIWTDEPPGCLVSNLVDDVSPS